MSIKKSTAMLIILCLLASLIACKGKAANKKIDDTKWHDEELTAPGDVFVKPDIKTAEGAPIIGELSSQVNPGNSITVTGEGFTGAKAYVYSQSSKDNGKASEAQVSFIDDSNIVVTVDSSIEYGAYGIYLENENGKSNLEIVNKPKIWWIGLTTLSAGDDINVYGENLTTDNAEGTDKVYGYLLSKDGKYRELSVKYADPYKVTFTMPDGLTDGEVYEIKLHNGHGGDDCFAAAPEKVKFSKDKVNSFNGKKIDVTDYGADPADNGNDDTTAVQKAVASASDGDIIYFPNGTYNLIGSITVNMSLKFIGDGDASIIKNDSLLDENGKSSKQMLVLGSACEFEKLHFYDVRDEKLSNGFIETKISYDKSGSFSLYVHNCKFTQFSKERSLKYCITASATENVIISDNEFEATSMLWTNDCKKVFLTGNNYTGVFYTGTYYNQNATLIWSTACFDASNNSICGKRLEKNKNGYLSESDDFSGGRAFAIQGFNYNHYISNNIIENTGLPKDNAGEQVMLENICNEYNDFAVSATDTSITLNKALSVKSNSVVLIAKGKGVGQWRFVKKVKNKELLLDREWTILPDETSRILVTSCFHNYAIYNNSFDCFTNHTEYETATCAVQIYGNTFNCFVNSNIMKNMAYGICVTSRYNLSDGDHDMQNVVYWTYIDNNTISDVSVGIKCLLALVKPSGAGEIPIYTSIGVAVRSNSFENMLDFGEKTYKAGLGGIGISVGKQNLDFVNRAETNTWIGPWEYGTIIENNTFKNSEIANIFLHKHQAGTVILSNKAEGTVTDVYTVDKNGTPPAAYR